MDFHQQYEIGYPIFQKFFSLNKKNLIDVMKDIFQDNLKVMEIIENNPRIIKTLENDEPEEISIYFYNSIKITCFGVYYKPEHGVQEKILKFDKFFNLNLENININN